MIQFRVYGRPAPQGSKKSIGGNRFVETSKYLPAWRAAVNAAAKAALPDGFVPFDEPVSIHMIFFIEPPKKPKFDWPAVAPDASKLQRAVEDALTGVIWVDDSRVVEWYGREEYANASNPPGVLITVDTDGITI